MKHPLGKSFRLGAIALMTCLLLFLAAGCGVDQGAPDQSQGSGGQTSSPTVEPTATPEPSETPAQEPESDEPELLGSEHHPEVTIEMSNGGIIKAELYPEVAPNTVNNFIALIQDGFYDGIIFHRVIPGFMIQGGDPNGVGSGGPGYSIAGEFSSNGFENKLKHTRGVLSMARTNMPDSAGSQFFIMVEEAPSLDEQYAAFGKVIEGMEVADEIVNQPKGAGDKPLEPLYMEKVTVDTKGMTFEAPVKVE